MQSEQEQLEALQSISRKMDLAYSLIQECVALSERHGVMFSTPWGGEGGCYMGGMGGQYIPEGNDHLRYGYDKGWNASSHSC